MKTRWNRAWVGVLFWVVALAAVAMARGQTCPNGMCPLIPVPADKPQLKSPYVMVEVKTTSRGRPAKNIGSGTVIHVEDGKAWIMTAEHVVETSKTATAVWFRGSRATGRILGRDRSTDIAVFLVTAPAGTTALHVLVDDLRLAPGTAVEVMGYPHQKFRKIRGTLRQNVRKLPGPENSLLDVKAFVEDGTSGGAIVASTVFGRRLVGVVSGSSKQHMMTTGGNHVYIGKLLKLVAPKCLARRRKPPPAPEEIPPIIEIPEDPVAKPKVPTLPEPSRDSTPLWVLLVGILAGFPSAVGIGAFTGARKSLRR